MFQLTTSIQKIAKLTKRLRFIQGGTSAAKTMGILAILIHMSQTDTEPTITSVVSESFPHLKRGAIKDFLNIMNQQGYFKDDNWNKTDFTYTFEGGSKIEFFSVDQPGKVRGPRRDRLFLNELNNIPFETFEQLEVRTKDVIFADWNPTSEFYAYTDILGRRDDVDHIILTYKDNEGLDPAIVQSIEARKDRKGWWQVYGLGLLGEVEGKIYKDWAIIDEVPHSARLERRGLDFGYTNDPSALVDIYFFNGGYIVDEIMYSTKMLNRPIAELILNQQQPETIVVADSAEPKSIAEIKQLGVNILRAEKGKDSVRNGIALVQDQRMSVTKRSVNVIKAYRNYLWASDKDGKLYTPNEPEHEFSHSMDAIRYALSSIIKKPNIKQAQQTAPLQGYYPEIGL